MAGSNSIARLPPFLRINSEYAESDNTLHYWSELEENSDNVFVTNPSHVDVELFVLPADKRANGHASAPNSHLNGGSADQYERLDITSMTVLDTTLQVSFLGRFSF